MSVPSPFFANDGALNKRNICLIALCLIVATLWNTSSVAGAPAKLDSLESPFPLDLQPPVFEASSTAYNGDSDAKTVDSYGNPIASLQPIETPDGRKVVSAQGLQFEIPNYASGITELKKPSDDLLPPFVGELSNDLEKQTTTTTRTTTASLSEGHVNDDKQGSRSHKDDNDANDNNNNSVYAATSKDLSGLNNDDSIGQPHMLRIQRQPKLQQTDINYQNNHNNNNNNNNLNINTLQQEQQQQNDEVLINFSQTNTNVALATTTNQPNQQQLSIDHKKLTTPPYSPSPSYSITNSLRLFVNKQINKPKSLSSDSSPLITTPPPSSYSPSASYSPSPSPLQFTNNDSLRSPFSKSKLSAQYAPISNGNFNYPNIPTDLSIIERIASKYKNPLPTLDPIVVAIPDDSTETLKNPSLAASSSAETTTVDVETVPLLEIPAETSQELKNSQEQFQGLPQYILDLNDPNIAGPVDYVPDNKGLKVIAWDLMPPYENDAETGNEQNQISSQEYDTTTTAGGIETSVSLSAQATQEQASVVDLQSQHSQTSQVTERHQLGAQANSAETTTKPNFSHQSRGSVHYSSTTQRPTTTTTRRTTTTTTPRPTTTTTPRTTTTTTRRSTTPRTTRATTTTTTTTTTAEPDTSEFYRLEAGDSYTLPPWLQDIDDPELDVAVTYIVPEDLNEYNQTIDRDILPPFEPFTDLNNLHVTTPSTHKQATSTTTPRTTTTTRRTTTTTAKPKTTSTTTTTTTRRPTLSTSQPHWVRAKPTTKPTLATLNNQFTTNFNHNQDSDNHVPSIVSSNFAQRTTTSTTTVKPKTTVNYYNRPLSNTPQTDKITSAEASGVTQQTKSKNPFLPSSYNDGSYRAQPSTTRRTTSTTTTTTSTTTTAAPEVYENPFEPTIPPWLKDFDYPDVGPGVPFVYNPNDEESAVDMDILPPSETSETNLKPSFITSPAASSPSPSFVNSPTPQGFTNKFFNSATSFTSSSSIPSKVTIPLPSTPQQTNQDDRTVSQPPLVFVPPPPQAAEDDIITANADAITKKTSSSFNKNFAAPFDPTTSSGSSSTTSDDSKKTPFGSDRESFPPFNNVVSDGTTGSSLPAKTTFSKSEDGKVITKNVFLNGGVGSASSKPFSVSNTVDNQQKDTFVTQSSIQFGGQAFSGSAFTKATTASTTYKQYGTTGFAAGGAATSSSSFGATTFGASSASSLGGAGAGSKYTGRFGGPPGILAPQSAGFTTAAPVTSSYYRPSAAVATTAAASSVSPSNNNYKFTGSFGGPPGVLQPYDTVKNRN